MLSQKVTLATPLDPALQALLRFQDPYSDDARALVSFLTAGGFGFTLGGLAAYYDHLKSRYESGAIKAATFNKRVAGAKKRVRQLIATGNASLTAADRFRLEEALSTFKTAKTRGLAVEASRLPTDEELGQLVSQTKDRLVRVLVPFLAETGARISEALAIRQTDVVKARGFYRITIRGKGNKEREIFAAPWLLERVRQMFNGETFLFEHQERPYSRIACTDRIKHESRAILARELSAHTWRHYFATRLLKEGKSLKAVSRFLGHSSTQTTADIYQHDSLAWEDLQDVSRERLYEKR
jgi:integrase